MSQVVAPTSPLPFSKAVKNKEKNYGGTWTLLCLLVIIGYLSMLTGGFYQFADDFPNVFDSNAPQVIEKTSNFMGIGLSAIFWSVLASLVFILCFQPKTKESPVILSMNGFVFAKLLLINAAEEVFARWFFLGVLSQYVDSYLFLFIVGNTLWSLLHLTNFNQTEDRKIIHIIPQFLAGIVFTYVYFKLGLMGAILVHMGYNCTVLVVDRLDKFDIVKQIRLFYCLLGSFIILVIFPNSFTNLIHIIQEQKIQFASSQDAMVAYVFCTFMINFLTLIMLFDDARTSDNVEPSFPIICLMLFFAAAIIFLGFLFVVGSYAFVFYMVPNLDVSLKLALIVMGITLANESRSGSSLGKTFWADLPFTCFTVWIYHTYGWQFLAYCMAANGFLMCFSFILIFTFFPQKKSFPLHLLES
jgi:hypothetical protein